MSCQRRGRRHSLVTDLFEKCDTGFDESIKLGKQTVNLC